MERKKLNYKIIFASMIFILSYTFSYSCTSSCHKPKEPLSQESTIIPTPAQGSTSAKEVIITPNPVIAIPAPEPKKFDSSQMQIQKEDNNQSPNLNLPPSPNSPSKSTLLIMF